MTDTPPAAKSPLRNDTKIVEHLWVPLPDGRRLAGRAWLPPGDAPAPGILEYLPYRKRDGTAPRDAQTHARFAAAGYACLRVDIAGTGESDGAFDDEYSEQELADGEAVLAWMAAQPWCSGKIGIIGISWGGFNGLQLAFRQAPALGAVVTVCSSTDRYADDIHYMGGCLLTDNFNWGAQMTAYNTRPPDPALRADWRPRWMERLAGTPFLAADWLRRPVRDGYWRHGSVCEDWAAIRVPVLAIGGWADAYVNTPLALVEHVPGAKALIGPWDHKYPHIARVGPAADFPGEVIGWFDQWLKGVESGAAALPAVRAYLQDHDAPSPRLKNRAGIWVSEAAWPAADPPQVLQLAAEGLGTVRGSGTAVVDTPLTVGQGAGYFCPGMRIDNELADDQAADDAASLTFDTEPYRHPGALLGRPVLELTLSADRPVAQLCARLTDVAPDGCSQRVSYRVLNLCHHAGHETPSALEPGKPVRVSFALNTCGHRIAPGHRLRLALSTSYWPVVWPSPERTRITLQLADCRLILPWRAGYEAVPGAAPAAVPSPGRSDVVQIRPPEADSRRSVDAHGVYRLETRDDFGTLHHDHGLRESHEVRQIFEILPEDPLSAAHRTEWVYRYERDGWSATICSTGEMSCEAGHFLLRRRVRAYEGAQEVFDRSLEDRVARGLL